MHAPPDAQAGEHDVDWTEEMARSGTSESWAVSGTEENNTSEDGEEEDLKVTAIFVGTAREVGSRGEDRFEPRPMRVDSPA